MGPIRRQGRSAAVTLVLVLWAVAPAVTVHARSPLPTVSDAGGTGSASPSPSLSVRPAATAIDTTGWLPFTSTRHGFTLRYPTDWTARHATAPWTYGSAVDHDMPADPATDELDMPDGGVFWMASRAIPTTTTGDQWWADYARSDGPVRPCWPALSDWQPIAFGDLVGAYHGGLQECGFTEAIIVVDGRAYAFAAGGPDRGIVDLATFKAVLSTVTLDPAAADDTLVAIPSLAPMSTIAPSPS